MFQKIVIIQSGSDGKKTKQNGVTCFKISTRIQYVILENILVDKYFTLANF